jgi:hypothetical protein
MKAKIENLLIFGTDEHYGTKVRQKAQDSPIIIKEFPKTGCQTSIEFGKINTYISNLLKLKIKNDHSILTRLAGVSSTEADLKRKYKKEFQKYKWYITFLIESFLDVDEAKIKEEPYRYWLSNESIFNITEKTKQENKPFVDFLILYLNRFNDNLFKNQIRNIVFLTIDNEQPLVSHKLSTSVVKYGGKHASSSMFKLKQIEVKLNKFDKNIIKMLKSSIKWYIEFLKETDQLKQFIYSFLSLEILVNKLFEKYFEEIKNEIKNDIYYRGFQIGSIGDTLIPQENRATLSQKFVIVCLKIFPEATDDLLKSFVKCKSYRDQLAHGSLNLDDKLPIEECNQILRTFYNIIIK